MTNEHDYYQAAVPQFHTPGGMHTPVSPYVTHGYYGGGIPAQGGAYAGMPAATYHTQGVYPYAAPQQRSLFDFTGDRFVKGLLIGAAATYLITNENIQKSAIKSVVKIWSFIQGGVEEIKERFHDAEAEIQAAEATRE